MMSIFVNYGVKKRVWCWFRYFREGIVVIFIGFNFFIDKIKKLK